jgi:hypothetical protein
VTRAQSTPYSLPTTQPTPAVVFLRQLLCHPSSSPVDTPATAPGTSMATAPRGGRVGDGDSVESAVGAEPLRAGTPSKDRSGFGATAASGDSAAAAAASSTAFVICTSIASSVLLIFTNKWVKLCACVNAPNLGLLGGGGGGYQWGSGSNHFSVVYIGVDWTLAAASLALGAPHPPPPLACVVTIASKM